MRREPSFGVCASCGHYRGEHPRIFCECEVVTAAGVFKCDCKVFVASPETMGEPEPTGRER